MKYIFVGNGIISYISIFQLLEHLSSADRITIIGGFERKNSGTMVAPAMLNSFAELEPDSLSTPLDQYKFELSRQASVEWPQLKVKILECARSLKLYPNELIDTYLGGDWFGCGTYVLNNAVADGLDDDNFNAIMQALVLYDEAHEVVDPKDVPGYQPGESARALRAVFIKNEGWFNPRIMMRILDKIFQAHPQVTVINDHVKRINQDAGGITSVETVEERAFSADKYVLAAGAATTDLIKNSDLALSTPRIFYGVGVTLEIAHEVPDFVKCVRTPNRGLACGLYSVPYYTEDNEKHIAIGASNYIATSMRHYGHLSAVTTLLDGAISQLNRSFYKAGLVNVNVGARPISQDSYPLIGKCSIKNLIIAAGTRREGVHLAPVIAQKIITLLNDGEVDVMFGKFSPERNLIHTLTREQAIDKAVKHLMSAAYQHGFVPPQSSMLQKIKDMYRVDIERLHDKVGAVDWGIPADMLDMYRYGHAVPDVLQAA